MMDLRGSYNMNDERKKSEIISDTIFFWRNIFASPIRIGLFIIILLLSWYKAGWIFHLLNSMVILIFAIIVAFGGTYYMFKIGALGEINWKSKVSQRIATLVMLAIVVLIFLY